MRDAYLEHAMHDAGRIELRHELDGRWMSGLFNDVGQLLAEIHRRAGAGNLYTSVNAPKLMPAPNRMGGRALADADIAFYTRLLFDFDPVRPKGMPSTDDELRHAVAARDRMVSALLGLGWPHPALAVSGNGAHAVYRCRFPVTPESVEMLATVYVGMKRDFSTETAAFDATVRNPARIWRLYGAINRKGTPTPDRPHRRAVATIPQRWRAVSVQQVAALASAYARRPRPAQPAEQRQRASVTGAGDYSTLDVVAWFASRGMYRRSLGDLKHAVRCPWDHEHSSVDPEHSTATVIWEARGGLWPQFKCSHQHCEGRGIEHVMALWGDADRHCSREWRAAR